MENIFHEVRYPLGEESDRMVTVSLFQSRIRIHVRQFYTDFYGKKKPGKTGISMNIREFEELVKLVPKLQEDLMNINSQFTNINDNKSEAVKPQEESSNIVNVIPEVVIPSDFDFNIFPPLPTVSEFKDVNNNVLPHTLGVLNKDVSILCNVPKKRKKNLDIENKKARKSEKSLTRKVETKKKTGVKRQCIDEVESVEVMKEVEKCLWLVHYDLLIEEFHKVTREKCLGCNTNEPIQLAHELCLFDSPQEQVDECFDDAYSKVNWNNVLDLWRKKIQNLTVEVNPEILLLFQETINHHETKYKDRLRKWMIESPTIEL